MNRVAFLLLTAIVAARASAAEVPEKVNEYSLVRVTLENNESGSVFRADKLPIAPVETDTTTYGFNFTGEPGHYVVIISSLSPSKQSVTQSLHTVEIVRRSGPTPPTPPNPPTPPTPPNPPDPPTPPTPPTPTLSEDAKSVYLEAVKLKNEPENLARVAAVFEELAKDIKDKKLESREVAHDTLIAKLEPFTLPTWTALESVLMSLLSSRGTTLEGIRLAAADIAAGLRAAVGG